MKLKARHKSKIKVQISPQEASLIALALMHARSSNATTQAALESTYSAWYMALEDAGFAPESGELQIKRPVRVKPEPDEDEDDGAAAESEIPWPPIVGQVVDALAFGCEPDDSYVRTKIKSVNLQDPSRPEFEVEVPDEYGHQTVNRELFEIRPVSS